MGPATQTITVIRHEDWALDHLPEGWRRRQLMGWETDFELELRLMLLSLLGHPRSQLDDAAAAWRDESVVIRTWETWNTA